MLMFGFCLVSTHPIKKHYYDHHPARIGFPAERDVCVPYYDYYFASVHMMMYLVAVYLAWPDFFVPLLHNKQARMFSVGEPSSCVQTYLILLQ
jgi:hypothetical protein